jgi:hypothetical protein
MRTQGHFLKHRGQPLEAMSSLPSLLAAAKATDSQPSGQMLIRCACSVRVCVCVHTCDAQSCGSSVWLKRLALPQRYGEKLFNMKARDDTAWLRRVTLCVCEIGQFRRRFGYIGECRSGHRCVAHNTRDR